jgi:hypothetical protein
LQLRTLTSPPATSHERALLQSENPTQTYKASVKWTKQRHLENVTSILLAPGSREQGASSQQPAGCASSREQGDLLQLRTRISGPPVTMEYSKLQSECPTQPFKASVKGTKERFGNCYEHHSCTWYQRTSSFTSGCASRRRSNLQFRTLTRPPATMEPCKVKA